MKKLVGLLVIICFTMVLSAQEKTLLGEDEIEHGGFGGPVVKFTSIKEEFGLLVGGRGGWIINHTITLGGAGYGLVNEIDMGKNAYGVATRLMLGYGGFDLGVILSSDELLHLNADVLIGAGAVNVAEVNREDWFDWEDSDYNDAFFVLEPSIGMELNITTFFRIEAGVSYRFVSGVDSYGLLNSDISGPSADLCLKFGAF